jgi:hypothetical protein
MNQPETMPEFAARFPILEFFSYDHLPERLQEPSRLFFQCAHQAVGMSFDSKNYAEVATGLRKLLEAKDCFVRANL